MNENTIHNDNSRPQAEVPQGGYRPKLTMYHPNNRGSGSAAQFALHPAHDSTDGSIMMQIANQKTVGCAGGSSPFSTFDWQNSIGVKLDFTDLTRMLQVFRGECEAIEGEYGLIHRSPSGTTIIQLKHQLEPIPGYALSVKRKKNDGTEVRSFLLLSNNEALGLSEAIAGSLSVICFGIPKVIPHDTSAYQAATKGMRNVAAA